MIALWVAWPKSARRYRGSAVRTHRPRRCIVIARAVGEEHSAWRVVWPKPPNNALQPDAARLRAATHSTCELFKRGRRHAGRHSLAPLFAARTCGRRAALASARGTGRAAERGSLARPEGTETIRRARVRVTHLRSRGWYRVSAEGCPDHPFPSRGMCVHPIHR